MSVPTHQSECSTKIFVTKCPDCNSEVYFFSCSCGSKVFFEDVGYPWPIHYCKKRELREIIEILKDIERYTDDEIAEVIINYEKAYDVEVPKAIMEIIEFHIGKRKYPFKVEKIEIDESIHDLDGKIMEYRKEVNLYKKFGYNKSSPFTKGLLGDLSSDEYGEITIRQNPNNKNISKEFRVLIKKGYKIYQGDYILGQLKVLKHSKGKVWVLIKHKCI
jgi:hypothetical protein